MTDEVWPAEETWRPTKPWRWATPNAVWTATYLAHLMMPTALRGSAVASFTELLFVGASLVALVTPLVAAVVSGRAAAAVWIGVVGEVGMCLGLGLAHLSPALRHDDGFGIGFLVVFTLGAMVAYPVALALVFWLGHLSRRLWRLHQGQRAPGA